VPNSYSREERTKLMGVRIDADVALRITRTLWDVLSDHDPVLKEKLASAMQAEVDSLTLQEELDEGGLTSHDSAIVQILKFYAGQNHR
jgi:hypothetical protein